MSKGNSPSTAAGHGTAIGRRKFLKTAAATGGALAASNIPLVNVVRAQSKIIKIGYITSKTGPRGEFSEAADWNVQQILNLVKGGLKIGNSNYEIQVLTRDNQSTATRAAQVGNELVLREKVDLLLGDDSESPVAVGELCDQVGTPFISTMTPWEPTIFARGGSPDKGWPWNWTFCFGIADLAPNYVGQWDLLKTNKIMGDTYFDNPGGVAFADDKVGIPGIARKHGYKVVSGGMHKGTTDDFSPQISLYKSNDVQILSGLIFAPQFATLWNQAAQTGFRPEIVNVAAAFLFPSGLEALGERGNGMITEVWWTPNVPFKSSLTGKSAKDLAADWQNATGKQWTQPLGYLHAEFEVAFQALKQAGDPKDKKAIQHAMNTMVLDTMVGPVNFKDSKIKSVAATEVAMGQWRLQKGGKYKYDLLITSNTTAPHIIPQTEAKLLSQLG